MYNCLGFVETCFFASAISKTRNDKEAIMGFLWYLGIKVLLLSILDRHRLKDSRSTRVCKGNKMARGDWIGCTVGENT
jgi:hypothetical protein